MKNVKNRLLFIVVFLMYLPAFSGCRNEPEIKNKDAVIALQPLNGYASGRLHFLKEELQRFYHRQVIVLPEKVMSSGYINRSKGRRYSGPEIIRWLSSLKPDTIICIAGLTSQDIYTTKKDKDGNIRKPESTYAVWGIFGLGYCPGGACVISDNRFMTPDESKFRHRLRSVVIHEIGHNLGLPHCPNSGCIMSDANEKLSTVDKSGKDYCQTCRQKAGI